jgi:hypothetical protein
MFIKNVFVYDNITVNTFPVVKKLSAVMNGYVLERFLGFYE